MASLLLLLAWLPLAPADSLHPTSPVRRLAYHYANDFFFGTDYYFTQGMTFDWACPALARSPANYLLPRGPAGSVRTHGVALRYDGFTPLSITDARIRKGDRPYAVYGYFSLYRVANQANKKQRLTTAVEIGYLGPAAGGKFVQTKLHELTHNPTPRGWDNQVHSDAVLGYRASFDKQLLALGRAAALVGNVEASLGTLYTYAGAGVRLRTGHFTPYFADVVPASWQLYTEATLSGRLVGYDASLQGGVFNRSSPYVLAFSQVNHAVLHSSGGVVLTHKGFSFTATAVFVGPELVGGRSHRWGVLALAREF